MAKGVLYGVGVGPGDPKLMTLKAVETIAACPIVAAPRTKNGGMVALDIARGAADLSDKEIIPLDFAMSRDPEARAASHRKAVDLLRPHLDAGRSVAMLNLGDISIYTTFRYIADMLAPEGYPVEMISGVPSFCAAAAVLGESLTDINTPLRIVPDGTGEPDGLNQTGTTVWMKSGKNLPALLERLNAAGLSEKILAVQNCGLPDQRIYRGLDGRDVEPGYFTVVILKNGMEDSGS